MKLTLLEFTVLSAIVDSKDMDVKGAMMIGRPVWKPNFPNEMHAAFVSCVDKELIVVTGYRSTPVVSLTRKGYEAYSNCDKTQFN